MSQGLKTILIVVGILIFIVLCTVTANRMIYGRSIIATIVERVIKSGESKTIFMGGDALSDYIELMRHSNSQSYSLPKDFEPAVAVEEYLSYDMQVFLFNPESTSNKAVVYWHGGAYINQPVKDQLKFMSRLSKELDISIYIPVYPKLPLNSYQDAYEAAEKFYEDLTATHQFDEIIFMGDSAGGGFALAFGQFLVQKGSPGPSQMILFSPWVDVSMDNQEMAEYEHVDPMVGIKGSKILGEMWAGDLDVHDPKVSPIYGDMTGLCPMTLYVGTREILYPDIIRLGETLSRQEAEFVLHVGKGMNHVYPFYPIPEAGKVFKEVVSLISDGF